MYFEYTVAEAIYRDVKTNPGKYPPEVEQQAVLYDLAPLGETYRAWWGFMVAITRYAEEISRMPED